MGNKRRGRGEGTLESLPSGKTRATRYAGKDADGEPIRERRTFDRKADAQAWLRRAAEERRGEWARKTLAEWLDRWLADKAGELEAASLKWYKDRVDRRIRTPLGALRLGDLSALNVRDWVTKMAEAGVSNRERHGALKTLRAALNAAIKAGQIARNVATEGAKLPKLRARSFSVWSPREAQQFLRAAEGDALSAYWWLALDSGCRPAELFGLHWPCVDRDRGGIHVRQALELVEGHKPKLKEPKTEAGNRFIPITVATMNRLQAHRARQRLKGKDTTDGPVFLNAWGTWLRMEEMRKRLVRLCKAAGVPRIKLKDLRHTSATLLLAEDVNVKIVSQRLGHTSIVVTLQHYAGFLPTMQEKAVRAMAWVLTNTSTERPSTGGSADKDDKRKWLERDELWTQ